MTSKHLPGYTGHIPSIEEEDIGIGHSEARSHIPGYKGYIPGIHSENLYGETYGKTTYKSSTNAFPKGLDVKPTYKYKTSQQDSFINLYNVKEKTAKEMLGVHARPDQGPMVIPPETHAAFWGHQDEQKQLAKNTEAFYGAGLPKKDFEDSGNDFEKNLAVFYGKEAQEKPSKHGEPIPGYTGVSRRVVADNVFGQTFANARKSAFSELKDQKQEKAEILNQRAIYVPEYRR